MKNVSTFLILLAATVSHLFSATVPVYADSVTGDVVSPSAFASGLPDSTGADYFLWGDGTGGWTQGAGDDAQQAIGIIDSFFGYVTIGSGATATSTGIAIGKNSLAFSADGVAIGSGAVNGYDGSIQLGYGESGADNTIQFRDSGGVTAEQFGTLIGASATFTATDQSNLDGLLGLSATALYTADIGVDVQAHSALLDAVDQDVSTGSNASFGTVKVDENLVMHVSPDDIGGITATTGSVTIGNRADLVFEEGDAATVYEKNKTTDLAAVSVFTALKTYVGSTYNQVYATDDGELYPVAPPEVSWTETDADNGTYDIGTGATTGPWVPMTGLFITIPEDVNTDDRVEAFYKIHVVNKTGNRSGSINFGFGLAGADPVSVADSKLIPDGFDGIVSGSLVSTTVSALASTVATMFCQINSGDHGSFGVDLDATTGDPHNVIVSSRAGGVPITSNNIENYATDKASFIVASSVDQTLSTDDNNPSTVVGFEMQSIDGFDLRASDGAIQNVTTREIIGISGNIAMQINNIGGGTKTISFWSEASDDGVTFTPIANSLRTREVSSSNESFLSTVSFTNSWPSTHWIRFVFSSSGGMEFYVPSITTNGTTVDGRSVVWELTEQ